MLSEAGTWTLTTPQQRGNQTISRLGQAIEWISAHLSYICVCPHLRQSVSQSVSHGVPPKISLLVQIK